MRTIIDLRSEFDFWSLSDRHRSLLALRFPRVSFVPLTHSSELTNLLSTVDVFFGWRFDSQFLDISRNLRWIASPAAGFDHLPVDEAGLRGIVVTRSFGFHGAPIAEHVMGLVIGFGRGLFLSAARQTSALWWKHEIASSFFDVAGATMAIVGCGTIGNTLARLACACGMRVLGVRRRLPPPDAAPVETCVARWYQTENVEQALSTAKVVVNLLPSTPETHGYFSAQRFAAMKPGGVFINVGRASTVDEVALLAALDTGHVSWCGLDVTAVKPPPLDSPLRSHPRVVLTPKTAVFSRTYMDDAVRFFAENMDRFLEGRPLRGVVTGTATKGVK